MSTKRTSGLGPPRDQDALRVLQREARVAQALREVAGALGASLELDELLELVMGKLTELVEADRAVLFVLDERKRELVSRVSSRGDEPIRVPMGDGLLGQVARTGRGLCVYDVAKQTHVADWDEALGTRTSSVMLTPLKNNLSRTIGVLIAINKHGDRGFSEDDEEILSVLAKQAAIAIDNSRLLVTLIRKNQQLQQAQEQLTRRVRDLELLFELERSTAHAHSHEELARAVLERLARACNAEGAALVLAEPGAQFAMQYALTRSFREPGATREESGLFRSSMLEVKETMLAAVLLGQAPVQLDIGDPAHWVSGVPFVRSMIGEPLEGDQHPIGALGLLDKRGGPFTAEDLGLLRLVSANVSTAVRLFDTNLAREREERLSSIGRLLSQVVHDLKSPLTVISGYVQLMEESEERETRAEYAGEILKQFQALVAMQREVLAFARGETQVFARRVLLDRFLADLKEQLDQELAGKNVDFALEAERKLVVHFDSERITRALTNLVRNAAEALAGHGGQVTLSARAHGSELEFEVSDDGPGVPEAIAPHLFESFVTSGKRDGTGLGLAIVKRIVNEHGGTVALVPSPSGACFRIVLPGAVLSPDDEAVPESTERVSFGSERPTLVTRKATQPVTARAKAPPQVDKPPPTGAKAKVSKARPAAAKRRPVAPKARPSAAKAAPKATKKLGKKTKAVAAARRPTSSRTKAKPGRRK